MEKKNKGLWKYPIFLDQYVDNNYIYAAGFQSNIFFRISRNDYSIEILGGFTGFIYENSWKIRSIHYYNDKLFLFSHLSYEVASYNLKSGDIEYFYPDMHNENFCCVRGTCRVGNDIWIFRNSVDELVCVFSLEKLEYYFYSISILNTDIIGQVKCDKMDIQNVILIGDCIWRCIIGSEFVTCLDVKKKTMNIIKLDMDVVLEEINYDYEENTLVFSLMNSNGLLCWDLDDDNKIIVGDNSRLECNEIFQEVVSFNNVLVALPALGCDIICYLNKESDGVKLQYPKRFKRVIDSQEAGLFFSWFLEGDFLYLFPFAGNGLLILNMITLLLEYKPLEFNELEFLLNKQNTEMSFISKAISIQSDLRDNYQGNLSCGKDIWDAIKGSRFDEK